MTTPKTADVVILDYKDLFPSSASSATESLQDAIKRAFGPDGVGLIAIRNVPGFIESKEAILSHAHGLAHLPKEELHELEDPDSLYNAGWSHGREKLKADTPDWNKASFYFNPLVDVPGTEEDRNRYPFSYPCNRWPREKSLPMFQFRAKMIGTLMKEVAVILSKHIDDYTCAVNPSYQANTLYNALKDTEKAKGRLLYYYPLGGGEEKKDENAAEDSWIGWHNDSGFLTCLSGGIFLQPDGTILDKSPSEEAGLYVVNRQDEVLRVKLPADCMGIQIGECTQILTGGAVVATPHCVRGAPGIARTSLACFIDTPPAYPLTSPPGGATTDLLAKSSSRVPPLAKRWTDGMAFGDFLGKTFEMYYEFASKGE